MACLSLHSPPDYSFLCVRGSGPSPGCLSLCDADLGIQTESRNCQHHPPPASPLTLFFAPPSRLQPQQQLWSAKQQQLSHRCVHLSPPHLLPGSPWPNGAQIQLQGLHLPPAPPVQPDRKRGRGGEPNHAATYTNSDHVYWISSKCSPVSCHPTKTRVILGEQRRARPPCYTNPTPSLWEYYQGLPRNPNLRGVSAPQADTNWDMDFHMKLD